MTIMITKIMMISGGVVNVIGTSAAVQCTKIPLVNSMSSLVDWLV